jgi:hypothetical protein
LLGLVPAIGRYVREEQQLFAAEVDRYQKIIDSAPYLRSHKATLSKLSNQVSEPGITLVEFQGRKAAFDTALRNMILTEASRLVTPERGQPVKDSFHIKGQESWLEVTLGGYIRNVKANATAGPATTEELLGLVPAIHAYVREEQQRFVGKRDELRDSQGQSTSYRSAPHPGPLPSAVKRTDPSSGGGGEGWGEGVEEFLSGRLKIIVISHEADLNKELGRLAGKIQKEMSQVRVKQGGRLRAGPHFILTADEATLNQLKVLPAQLVETAAWNQAEMRTAFQMAAAHLSQDMLADELRDEIRNVFVKIMDRFEIRLAGLQSFSDRIAPYVRATFVVARSA